MCKNILGKTKIFSWWREAAKFCLNQSKKFSSFEIASVGVDLVEIFLFRLEPRFVMFVSVGTDILVFSMTE